MGINVCPAANVAAPVEDVWKLLANPERYDEWWDAHVEHMEPPGPAVAGQHITASTRALGKRFSVGFKVEQIDPEKHKIQLNVSLPLGITELTTIICTPIDEHSCRVQFG